MRSACLTLTPPLSAFICFWIVTTEWPVFLVLHLTGVEELWVPTGTFLLESFLGWAATTLMVIFFLAALILTSPLYATLGSVLALPGSVAADWFFNAFVCDRVTQFMSIHVKTIKIKSVSQVGSGQISSVLLSQPKSTCQLKSSDTWKV